MTDAVAFRFDAADHSYYLGGRLVPSITQMLERAGVVDSRWFTEESSERGRQIHSLTADYDLGALHAASCVSRYRGYLLAHIAAIQIMRPEILAVEEPLVHATLHFGGRPDRVGRFFGLAGVLEGKSGEGARSHQIQTALQAILVAPGLHLPPEGLIRLCLYWKASGRFRLEEHKDRRDFDEARRIVKRCCQ